MQSDLYQSEAVGLSIVNFQMESFYARSACYQTSLLSSILRFRKFLVLQLFSGLETQDIYNPPIIAISEFLKDFNQASSCLGQFFLHPNLS
jgi:hypothetical protein